MLSLDYGQLASQFVLSGLLNSTHRQWAAHVEQFGRDAIQRYLTDEQIPPHQVWENARDQIVTGPNGWLTFAEQMSDAAQSQMVELAHQPWGGNARSAIQAIGVVSGVYVNPDTNQFWVIDYRLFAPGTDVKSKLDHMRDMLSNAVQHKRLPFRAVWLESGSKDEMLFIEQLAKVYYCPVQATRLVNLNGDDQRRQPVETLSWSTDELRTGRWVHLPGFPASYQVKLFRLERLAGPVGYIVTNDSSATISGFLEK